MSKKVLFVGLGSAGQRHLRNLLKITRGDVEVLAFRYHKSECVFDDRMHIIEGETLSNKYAIREFDDYDEALRERPDIVIIANPNNMHITYALKAVTQGCNVFVEKPLGTEIAQTEELVRTIREKDIICQVGYQYRYHPCIQLTKQYLEEGRLGKIVSVDVWVGERLTKMHPYEDYRKMQEGHKDLGGGVVLCQIHELDYLLWMFGAPYSVFSTGGKKSALDIDVEDVATTVLRYGEDGGDFSVVLHQDFLQYPPVRKGKFIGTEGKVEIDLLKGYFRFDLYESELFEEKDFEDFDRNRMFLEELEDYFYCIDGRKKPLCDAESAFLTTKVGILIKQSMEEKKEVMIHGIL